MELENVTVGMRVTVQNVLAPGLSAAGEVIAVDPHHSGMCAVTVRHDTGCERRGRDWAHAASSLVPTPTEAPISGTDAGPLNLHDRTAAQFEAEGRAAYPAGCNPYNASTMAHSRWAIGWHHADAIKLDAAQMFKVHDIEGNEWLVSDTHSGPHGTDMPGRAYWAQRMHDTRKRLSTVMPGIMGKYLPSLEAVHATLARKA